LPVNDHPTGSAGRRPWSDPGLLSASPVWEQRPRSRCRPKRPPFAAQGHHVYPFHLGDLNIPTPNNVVEASFKAIREGKTGYCPNAGIPELRSAVAADMKRLARPQLRRGERRHRDGGKPVIGKFMLALMNPGDEVLYPNPGYPIYESQIEFHGGVAVPYSYLEGEHGFVIDLDALEAAITPQTRLLVLNDLQNPMGAECSADELEHLAELVLRHDLTVLCDEDLLRHPLLGCQHVAGVAAGHGRAQRHPSTRSPRSSAMTGWRLGAAIGPREVIEVDRQGSTPTTESCPNHFIQYGRPRGPQRADQSGPRRIISVLRERRDAAARILNRDTWYLLLHAERDLSTFFPTSPAPWRTRLFTNVEDFRRAVLHETGVSACSRVHFSRPQPGEAEQYLRLAYSGIGHRADRRGTRAPEGLSRRRPKRCLGVRSACL